MNVVTYPPQGLVITRAAHLLAELFPNFDGPVEGNPCHYLGMCEVLRRPAHFPNALVRSAPDPRQVTEKGAADRDRAVERRQAMAVGMIEGVEIAQHFEDRPGDAEPALDRLIEDLVLLPSAIGRQR